jgi:hypothetical protein
MALIQFDTVADAPLLREFATWSGDAFLLPHIPGVDLRAAENALEAAIFGMPWLLSSLVSHMPELTLVGQPPEHAALL